MIIYLKQLFIDTWADSEKIAREHNADNKNRFYSLSILIILIYVALGNSILAYFGHIEIITHNIFKNNFNESTIWFYRLFYATDLGKLYQKLYWSGSIVLIYFAIPVLIIKFIFKKPLRNYGLSFNNIGKDYPIYIVLFGLMLPILYFISFLPSFQDKYPFFQPTKEQFFPYFIVWEVAYFIQFIALEFFYRGFIIHGLKQRFGFYAVFVSMIPYCMIHFGKPFPETIAAIFAGILLGTLSLKSRSIVLGILLHFAVALIMDLLALYQKGWFNP